MSINSFWKICSLHASNTVLDRFAIQLIPKLLTMTCTRFNSARPAALNLSQSQNANNTLAAAIDNHSFWLQGLGDSPYVGPECRCRWLTRGVQQLGFVGALIYDYDREHFYDNTAYWPFFEWAQEFDVPNYLHPAYPARDWTSRIQRGLRPCCHLQSWYLRVGLA